MSIFDRYVRRPEETVSKQDTTDEQGIDAGEPDALDRQVIRNERTGRLEVVTTNDDGSKSAEPYIEPEE